jgi:phosphoglycolate phosphatase-like HAD superfamily hydrolase/8-oxo-dGTP pyrophosphatase MutT (NUDIX family)
MKSYGMYIFDLDDTLLNTFKEVTRYHLPYVARTLGKKQPSRSRVRRFWGGDLQSSLASIFSDRDSSQAIVEIMKAYSKEHPISPTKDIQNIIRRLNKHQKYLAIFSDRTEESIKESILFELGLEIQNFNAVISTVDHKVKKPCPDLINIICSKYRKDRHADIKSSDIVYLGDTLADLQTARQRMIDFIAISNNRTRKSIFMKNGVPPEYIYPSVSGALTPPPSHGVVVWIKNKAGKYLLIKEGRKSNPYYGAWSGPHGRCQKTDIIEEETVVRETMEECGLVVRPIRKISEGLADTKIKTIGYWEADLASGQTISDAIIDRKEVQAISWFSLKEIKSGSIPLYPGTKGFFREFK